MPGNSSDIKVVSGHYSGHFSFQKYEENKEFTIEPSNFGFEISWDSELYLCIQISFRRSNLLFSYTQVNRICPTFAKFISQRINIKSLVKMVYLGKHTKLSENIVPERSPANVNRIRFTKLNHTNPTQPIFGKCIIILKIDHLYFDAAILVVSSTASGTMDIQRPSPKQWVSLRRTQGVHHSKKNKLN